MFKFFSRIAKEAVSAASEFIAPLSRGIGEIYGRINKAENKDEIIEKIHDIADTQPGEIALDVAEIADIVEESDNNSVMPDAIGDAISETISPQSDTTLDDGFWHSVYDEMKDTSGIENYQDVAINDNQMYHMTVTYYATMIDGDIVQRTIERYNYYDNDVINRMIWQDLFAHGDNDGDDVDTGDVGSVGFSVSIW